MRAAVIENGVVVNIIVIDSPAIMPHLNLIPAEDASIGDLWDGKQFIPFGKTAQAGDKNA